MADIMKMGKNPNYLGSWDLDELPNREITLTIDRIVDDKVVDTATGKDKIETLCFWTDKTVKPMILNVTNKKTICKLYKTKDTEHLAGKSITIGIEKVRAFGDVYDALRIRPRIPVQPLAGSLPKCEQCGKDITAAGNMNPAQVADYRKKRYGKALCNDCAKAAAEGAKE